MKTAASNKELLALEEQYWQAFKNQDVDTLLSLTNDPCIVAGAQGVSQIDRKTLAKMVRNANYTLDDFDLVDEQVHRIGDDVAIVSYKVLERLTVEGKHVNLEAADTSTWVRSGDRWLCAQHSESLIGDPFGRDRKPRAQAH